MPIVTVYQHGSSAGIPGSNGGMAGKRGTASGWNAQTTRRNVAFLRSVTLSELTGDGYAFTLTLKHCPPSHDHWHRLRRSFHKRMERMGSSRIHWVTEWQRRGVPHLHGVVYFPTGTSSYRTPHDLVTHWLKAAEAYEPAPWSQHIKPITDSLGWLQYLAKHSARGARHYQRDSANMPQGWQKPGRIWGKSGDWPVKESTQINLDKPGFFKYRRVLRSWRKADARSSQNGKRIQHARSMLKANKRELGEIRGVSEWIPESVSMAVVHWVAAQGHHVTS